MPPPWTSLRFIRPDLPAPHKRDSGEKRRCLKTGLSWTIVLDMNGYHIDAAVPGDSHSAHNTVQQYDDPAEASAAIKQTAERT
jgi:hypothetical protein